MEEYETEEDYEREARALLAALEEKEEQATPLKGLINEARNIVARYDHTAGLAARLEVMNRHNAPAYFNDLIAKLGNITEETLNDISTDLDARLVKQAQSLDAMHDLFLHLSPYALAQDARTLQTHINLALRTQDQSARTIEKFKKLREKPFGIRERTEQI